MPSKQEYVAACVEYVERFPHKFIMHYFTRRWRGKKQRKGVAIAFLKEGQVYLGHSLCKIPDDEFNKWIGLFKALMNAKPPYIKSCAPQSICKHCQIMQARAFRYYKVGKSEKSDTNATERGIIG